MLSGFMMTFGFSIIFYIEIGFSTQDNELWWNTFIIHYYISRERLKNSWSKSGNKIMNEEKIFSHFFIKSDILSIIRGMHTLLPKFIYIENWYSDILILDKGSYRCPRRDSFLLHQAHRLFLDLHLRYWIIGNNQGESTKHHPEDQKISKDYGCHFFHVKLGSCVSVHA